MVMSLSKSFKVMICAVLIASMFSGCINTVHLKDLVVVEGMGIDMKEDKVNLFVQTLEAGNSTGGEAPQGNMTTNTGETGDTIVDAVAMLSKSLSKQLFFGQNKLIIFSREAAEKDFGKKLDYFLRSSDSRPDVAVCISDSTAKDIIESKEKNAHIPSENIVYLLENGQDSGVSAYVTTNELLNMYSDKTSDIYLPVLKKEKKAENVQAHGIGLFNNEKLVYTTNDEETRGFLFLAGKIKNCSIEFEDRELGYVSVEVLSPKVKKHIEIQDGNIIFKAEIKGQIMINEIEKGIITSLDKEKIDRIRSNAENEIEKNCTQAFSACRDNGSDALRVGEYLAKDSPKSYDKLADEWDTYYKTVNLSVHADMSLKKLSDNTQLE